MLALRRDVVGYVSQFLRVIPRVSALDVNGNTGNDLSDATFTITGIENIAKPPDCARSDARRSADSADVSGRKSRYATPTAPTTATPIPTFFAVDIVLLGCDPGS